jgi:type II secretory pathway component PulC
MTRSLPESRARACSRANLHGSVAAALAALALFSSVNACGGATAATKVAKTPEPAAATSTQTQSPAQEAPSDHTLRRSVVRSVVKGGLGLFLQHVVLDDKPILKDGRFHGFRIAAFPDPGFWKGVDLQPGDVIVRVNGMPVEHPEEALEAFHSLEVASELRVAYERQGEGRELSYRIVDDEPQRRADASAP